MVIRLGPVRKTKLVLDRELIQDFKMVDVLLIHFSTDLGIFQETSRYLCPYLLNYPIATRIVHSRVVKKDFSACHPTWRFSQISCFFAFISSRHFSGQELLQFFHSMGQVTNEPDLWSLVCWETDMHLMYVPGAVIRLAPSRLFMRKTSDSHKNGLWESLRSNKRF